MRKTDDTKFILQRNSVLVFKERFYFYILLENMVSAKKKTHFLIFCNSILIAATLLISISMFPYRYYMFVIWLNDLLLWKVIHTYPMVA